MFVTIAIPFYNAEKYLLNAIKSVFAQTHTQWELILIDDGSTDSSLKIAKSIKDSRVRVISDGKNKKLATRLNEITKLAKYDLIARMDADDLMSPTRIEKQINILRNNPNIDLVTTGLFSISDDLKLIGARWHHSTRITFNEILNKISCGVVHAAIIGRKQWFLRNPYNENLKIAQDYGLWIKSMAKNDFKIHLVQEPLYYYREEGSLNAKKLLLAYQYERKLYKKYTPTNKFFLILKSYVKTIIVYSLNKLNKFQFLINRRSTEIISEELLDLFNDEINTILSVKLTLNE